MKKTLYFIPMLIAGFVTLSLSACDEPNTQPQESPVWDESKGPNPADECPRADGLNCF